ncbi:hypothetical protein D9757_010215 [Collybiopsis confluens]|uniref:F-box domain-containing protein n=1 Tax=Collybiopsis confluens TaxID=2823264 RepID=A0A8H5CN51_9AGAR|nr:hypothetical protein D9757_014536 [Collybiopsis confluens]KAF5368662.1 hypothetical protein D9757_010215 [Collybiopsis confluens]
MHQCAQCGESLPKPRISLNFPSLHTRLRSELGPASVQPEEVASILKSVELDLEDLDAEIARLELQILFLNTLKERHREYGNQFKTLLSPIRRLPDELLCEVFDWCCGMNCFFVTELPVSTAFTFKSAPAMALSSVCSRWRRIALAMPSIWSRIALDWGARVSSEGPWGNENTFPLFLSLARSLSRPLTIELNAIHSNLELSVGYDGHLHPIIAKLTEQVHRWQKFTLVESGLCMLKDLFIETSQFPMLEDMELHEYEVSTVDFLAGKAPNLKKLTWDGWPPLPVSISTEIFPQIVHIESSLEPALLEDLLEANPNLISLTAEGNENLWSEEEYIARPRTCPRMETLSVQDLEDNYPEKSVFSAMRCPSLKSLHLSCLQRIHAWTGFNFFMDFVQRSSFPLTTLCLNNFPLSDSNLVYLLNHVPTLMNLTVDDTRRPHYEAKDPELELNPFTERFINSLHAYQTSSLRSNASPIVPRLRSLTLSSRVKEFNDAAVMDMVRSRWFPSALSRALGEIEAWNVSPFHVDCLREFTLNFRARKKVNSTVYAPLEQLEKIGMRAVVLWGLT